MARPFSYPEVQQLEVGARCTVQAPVSEVKRKVALYAARHGKRFTVLHGPSNESGQPAAIVFREEVTDAELPSAA